MRPSKDFRMNRDLLRLIFDRYPMFSNYRLTGSAGQYEDTDGDDLDFYFDADSSATLFDIGRLQEDLENVFSVNVDLISSNRELAMFYEKNFAQFKGRNDYV